MKLLISPTDMLIDFISDAVVRMWLTVSPFLVFNETGTSSAPMYSLHTGVSWIGGAATAGPQP